MYVIAGQTSNGLTLLREPIQKFNFFPIFFILRATPGTSAIIQLSPL